MPIKTALLDPPALPEPPANPDDLPILYALDRDAIALLTSTERAELAAVRTFIAAFRAWCVDSSHYSRMMAAFADYQHAIK